MTLPWNEITVLYSYAKPIPIDATVLLQKKMLRHLVVYPANDTGEDRSSTASLEARTTQHKHISTVRIYPSCPSPDPDMRPTNHSPALAADVASKGNDGKNQKEKPNKKTSCGRHYNMYCGIPSTGWDMIPEGPLKEIDTFSSSS